MKITILFTWLFIYSCTASSEEQIKRIDDPLLASLMAISEVTDLNKLQIDIEKNLWLKIYKLPGSELNDCFPESHGICNYKYYLATSQLDDCPIINTYYLGELGEVTNYEWAATDEMDTATITIKTNIFSKEALNYNKSLKNKEIDYKLVAKPNNIQLIKKGGAR